MQRKTWTLQNDEYRCSECDTKVEGYYNLTCACIYGKTQPIAVGLVSDDWRCTQRRFDFTVGCAEGLVELGATNLSVYYDPQEDYMIIEFSIDGDAYRVQVYKLFAVAKNGWDYWSSKTFNTESQMFWFFEDGRHKNWHESKH